MSESNGTNGVMVVGVGVVGAGIFNLFKGDTFIGVFTIVFGIIAMVISYNVGVAMKRRRGHKSKATR